MAEKLTKKQVKQKAKERKATVIFALCLVTILALAIIIAISFQAVKNNKPKEDVTEQEECLRIVFYTEEETGKLKYKQLADGYCVAMKESNMGDCNYVDDYGVCYDSDNNARKKSVLIVY